MRLCRLFAFLSLFIGECLAYYGFQRDPCAFFDQVFSDKTLPASDEAELARACIECGEALKSPLAKTLCANVQRRRLENPQQCLSRTPVDSRNCVPMTSWDISTTQAWLNKTLAHEQYFLNKYEIEVFLQACRDHHIGGEALRALSESDLERFGLNRTGTRKVLLRTIAGSVSALNANTVPTHDPCSGYYKKPFEYWIDFYVVRVTEIDEMKYTFSAVYWVMESWKDDRQDFLVPADIEDHYTRPNECASHTMTGGCADPLWNGISGRDKLFYPDNLVEADVLSEDTLFLGNFSGLQHTVIKQTLVKATYSIQMTFKDFPLDRQNFSARFSVDVSKEPVTIQIGQVGYKVSQYEDSPGWYLSSVGATSYRENMLDSKNWKFYSIYKSKCHAAGNDLNRNDQDEHMQPLYLELYFVLERNSGFYFLNMILPVFLLQILSYTSFFLKAEQIDVRLGTTMTIFLALTAFQIIINDSLPKTGEVTKINFFLTFSNICLVITGLESLFVYYLHTNGLSKRSTRFIKLLTLPSLHKTSGRGKRHAVVEVAAAPTTDNDSATPSPASQDGSVLTRDEAIHRLDYIFLILLVLTYFIVGMVTFQRPSH